MKKLNYIIILFALVALFSCEQEDHLFTEDMANVGFYGESASMLEVDKAMGGKDTLTVQIQVMALKNSPSCEVTFDVDNSWYKEIDGAYYSASDESVQVNPAMEGVDFNVISSKTVTISDGLGYASVVVAAIDNNDYDPNGNKSFKLKITSNSLGYNLSSESVMTVSITDDDHPLGWMFGDYLANVTETANGNTSHPISISAVEGETDAVKIYGMSGTKYGAPLADPYYILGTVSEDYSTITIMAGQEWDSWNWGPTKLTVWEDDNGDGEEVDQLVGTINTSSGVVITLSQQYTFMITSGNNEGLGLQWNWNSDANANSPTSVWTKQ
ncbi:MAG: hypothetical protein ACK5M7_13840 [Draconibacterium sp.]